MSALAPLLFGTYTSSCPLPEEATKFKCKSCWKDHTIYIVFVVLQYLLGDGRWQTLKKMWSRKKQQDIYPTSSPSIIKNYSSSFCTQEKIVWLKIAWFILPLKCKILWEKATHAFCAVHCKRLEKAILTYWCKSNDGSKRGKKRDREDRFGGCSAVALNRGWLCPLEDIWQCLEIFYVVTVEGWWSTSRQRLRIQLNPTMHRAVPSTKNDPWCAKAEKAHLTVCNGGWQSVL